MNNTPFPIQTTEDPKVIIKDNQSAYSHIFKDIYFQAEIGIEEKKHVYLKGNNLPNNWLNKQYFTIAETGFGVGINFLSTLQSWQKTKTKTQKLHYISCELHPLSIDELTHVLKQFPQLDKYSKQLLKQYPKELIYGFHRLHFDGLDLTLIFADAHNAFEQLNTQVDAWFLDGFAPSKNPSLWNQKLFKTIANISHIGTTVATYTVARIIRDNLKSVGFEINKVKGFGQKREMLTAQMVKEYKIIKKQPWSQTFKASGVKTYTILGAGIAGLTLADKLTKHGLNVTLIDRQIKPCLETSGNPQAMIMPSFDLNGSIDSQFYLSAFLYALKYYKSDYYHKVGVYNLTFNDKQKVWQDKLLRRINLPHSLIRHYKDGILYPQAGWLDTQGHAYDISQTIKNYLKAEISEIQYIDNQWCLLADTGIVHKSDALILACGMHCKKLLKNHELPIVAKHGEISYFHTNLRRQLSKYQHIILNKGYITPSWKGLQTIGASFNHLQENDWYKPAQTTFNHWQENLSLWKDTEYEKYFATIKSHKSRAGIRVTTADHLPICGAVIDQQQFAKDYHDICHGKHWISYPKPKNIKNLYLFTGLGSRGFTSAPLLAESLCNQLLGQPSCLPQIQQAIIHPNRFLYRSLKTKKA